MKYLILTLIALSLVGCNSSATVGEGEFVLEQTPNLADNGYEDNTYQFKQMYPSPSFNSGVPERNPHITNLGNESWRLTDIVKNGRQQTYHIKSFNNITQNIDVEKYLKDIYGNHLYTFKIIKNNINYNSIKKFSNSISDISFGNYTYVDENNEINYIDSTKYTINTTIAHRSSHTEEIVLGAKLDLPDNLLSSSHSQPLFTYEGMPKETYLRRLDGEFGQRRFIAVGGDILTGMPTGTHQYGGSIELTNGILTANSRSNYLLFSPMVADALYKTGANLILSYSSGKGHPDYAKNFDSLGTVFVEANFDNLTGSVYDVAMGRDMLGKMEGSININASDGSYTGTGKFIHPSVILSSRQPIYPSAAPTGEDWSVDIDTNISIIGSFHGNQANGISGIYYSGIDTYTNNDISQSQKVGVMGWFVAKKR